MAQQTRRSPGRPKKVQAEEIQTAVAEAPKPKKKSVIKRKENLSTVVEYEIQRGGGVAYMLPQKGVTVFDKENNTVREVRYCPNEPSIYVDEQSDNAIKESVIFREGRLFVPQNKPNLKSFLDEHPFNVENGGHIFKLVDKKRDAEVELMKEFKASEAIGMVRDKDINELLPMYLQSYIHHPMASDNLAAHQLL